MPASDPLWDDQDESQGAFENLLERVTSQFTPNHNSQYQPGFVPAGSHDWNNTYSNQSESGIYANRSYSVTQQEQFTDICSTPLNRSSSDLGVRMNDYSSEVFQPMVSILQHSPIENIDGSGTFFPNQTPSIPSASMKSIPNISGYNATPSLESNVNQHYGSPNTAGNFATKLSNFRATLGTWASPLDCKAPNSMECIGESYHQVLPQQLSDYKNSTLENDAYQSSCSVNAKIPLSSKPSYSDVVSKAPSLDKMNMNCSQNQQAKINTRSHQHSKHRIDNSKHSSNNQGKLKNRYTNNNNPVRSSSPLTNMPNNKAPSKQEQTCKVGLDEFEGPGHAQTNTQNSMSPKTIQSKTQSSPSHHHRKNKKEKQDEVPEVIEKYSDQLNNHVLSNQKKQTLKKSSFINNVLNAPVTQHSVPLKKNNAEFLNNSKKGMSNKDAKFDYDGFENNGKRDSSCRNSSFSGYGSSKENDSSRSNTASRSSKSNNNRIEKNKESFKKSTSKKKKEEAISDHQGHSDRKIPSGLESNISLPANGEAAMKRLLAGRGKDPYSILGVTRTCSDEDIKKYYKRQAFLVHPDKNKQPGAEEAFKILAHAFELIGEPERRAQYDAKLSEEVQLEGAWGELSSLMTRLREKIEEAANTIRCTNCNKRHKRVRQARPVYGARYCSECQFMHAAREGDIWAESTLLGIRWRYYACMEGGIYDITEWASCQKENLKHLQANTHSVQYRIVSGKKNPSGRGSQYECPTEPELEEFFNNLCRERFGQDFASSGNSFSHSDSRKKKTKKRK